MDFQAVGSADGIRDDGARAAAAEELGESVGWLRDGGEANTLKGVRSAGLEAFESERKQRSPLVFGEEVEFVDDDGFGLEGIAPQVLGEEGA